MQQKYAFSLIEMLVTLTILGILIGIAYPSYTHYVMTTHRAQAKTALLDLAARMEHYYSMNNTYVGASVANIGANESTENKDYHLTINSATAMSFDLRAIPNGIQAIEDTTCATFTYNQLGVKGITGTGTVADCW